MRETKNILSLFLVSVLIFVFVALPKFEIFLREKRILNDKREEFTIQDQYFKKLKELNSELVFYSPKLKLIDLIISDESIVPSFVYYLAATSQNNGLFLEGIGSVSKNLSAAYPDLNEISVSFTLSGSYNDFKNFINSLEKSIKAVKIDSISVSSGGGGDDDQNSQNIEEFDYNSLTYNVSITIYYY